jgi:hypothetical protein
MTMTTDTENTDKPALIESAVEQFQRLDSQAQEAARDAQATAAHALRHAWDAGQIVAHMAESGVDPIKFAQLVGRPAAIVQRYRSLNARRKRDELDDPAQLRLFRLPGEEEPKKDERGNQKREVRQWESSLSRLMVDLARLKQERPIATWTGPECERFLALTRGLAETRAQIERRRDEA